MNKLIILLSALILFTVSCTKKDNYRDKAQIIGYDITKCGCCGGYMIKIAGDNSNDYYLAKTLPSGAGINPMSNYPINVEIDYDKNDKSCDKVITVSRLSIK